MILLRNISKGKAHEAVIQAQNQFGGSAGQPWRIHLVPGQEMLIMKSTFAQYHPYAKQTLAEFAQSGLLAAYTVDTAHKPLDRAHNCIYGYD